MNKMRKPMRDESRAVIPGFRAVEASREWKLRVARETANMTHWERVAYYRDAVRKLRSERKTPVVSEDEGKYGKG